MRARHEAIGGPIPPRAAAPLTQPMATIQLALTDPRRREELKRMLAASSSCAVECVQRPDWRVSGVLVVDPASLADLPQPIDNPERVVLITQDDAGSLKNAWEAGVSSVVFDRDPMSTIVLAVLSACLKLNNTRGPMHS